MRFEKYLIEAKELNAKKVPLDKARKYAESVFEENGKTLNEVLPDFDKNYMALQSLYKKHALGVKRIDMPVIEPEDMKTFDERLKSGKIDLFKPHTFGKAVFPKNFSTIDKIDWLELGEKDGDPNDDKLKAKWGMKQAKDLKPLQSEVWLEKLANNIAKFGKPSSSSPVVKTTIIVSKEGYILDGHHRHGQVMLADPSLKMKALIIPLDIKTLLKMGKSYGEAIGNKGKA